MLHRTINQNVKRWPNCTLLTLLNCYILNYRLKNKWLALHDLETMSQKQIQPMFSAYRIQSKVESEMLEGELRK
jgi:hypothetical protein